MNIKLEHLSDTADDADISMSARAKAFKLIVEVPNNSDQTLQKVHWMAGILKTSLGAEVKLLKIEDSTLRRKSPLGT